MAGTSLFEGCRIAIANEREAWVYLDNRSIGLYEGSGRVRQLVESLLVPEGHSLVTWTEQLVRSSEDTVVLDLEELDVPLETIKEPA